MHCLCCRNSKSSHYSQNILRRGSLVGRGRGDRCQGSERFPGIEYSGHLTMCGVLFRKSSFCSTPLRLRPFTPSPLHPLTPPPLHPFTPSPPPPPPLTLHSTPLHAAPHSRRSPHSLHSLTHSTHSLTHTTPQTRAAQRGRCPDIRPRSNLPDPRLGCSGIRVGPISPTKFEDSGAYAFLSPKLRNFRI